MPEPHLPTGAGGGAAKRAHLLWCPGTARQWGTRQVLWAGASPCTVSSAGSPLHLASEAAQVSTGVRGVHRGGCRGHKENQTLGSTDLHSAA